MKRVLTAALLAPPICYVVYAGHFWIFMGVVAAVAILCYHEFRAIAAAHGVEISGPLGYAAGLLLLIVPGQELAVVTLVALLAFSLALRRAELRQILPETAFLVLGVIYIFGSFRMAAGLRQISPHWLVYALALNWVGDTAAYYAGRTLGRHKLAARLSPAKTWEGAIASAVVSVVFGVVYLARFLPSTPWFETVPLTLAVNVFGQFGDLAESGLKRGAGLKDSGKLLPGHGGWLDRVDSSLFAFPVLYLWLTR